MRKYILVGLGVFALAGCAGQVRMPLLAAYDAEFVPYASRESVEAVNFHKPGLPGDLAACVAATVSNQGETLTDSSGSFFGAYTGHYYNVDRSVQTAGGSVLEYSSDDGDAAVASGSTRYQASTLVSRSVRFKLSAQQSETGRTYRYTSLAQAQLNSGAAANTGYNPIGAWAGANPDLALKALSVLTDQIESCLKR